MKPLEETPRDDLRERFILWLASKPGDEVYNWNSWVHCACGKFIRAAGCISMERRRPYKWFPWFSYEVRVENPEANEVWARWNYLAGDTPRTYGALLERVRLEQATEDCLKEQRQNWGRPAFPDYGTFVTAQQVLAGGRQC